MRPVKLVIYTLFTFSACQFNSHKAATESKNVLDTLPIFNLIRYDRDGTEFRYWIQPKKLNEIIQRRDSVAIPELGLVAYLFQWGGEVGGPFKRVLCFSRPEDHFQREFFYEGEYPMSRMGVGEELESGENHALGLQLSQLAMELGVKVSSDSLSMERLLVATFEKLLRCPAIQLSTMDSISKGQLKHTHFYDYYPWVELSASCQETLNNMQKDLSSSKKTAYYFQGDLTNGIWKAQLVREENNRYYIDLDYLNGECAFTVWF